MIREEFICWPIRCKYICVVRVVIYVDINIKPEQIFGLAKLICPKPGAADLSSVQECPLFTSVFLSSLKTVIG